MNSNTDCFFQLSQNGLTVLPSYLFGYLLLANIVMFLLNTLLAYSFFYYALKTQKFNVNLDNEMVESIVSKLWTTVSKKIVNSVFKKKKANDDSVDGATVEEIQETSEDENENEETEEITKEPIVDNKFSDFDTPTLSQKSNTLNIGGTNQALSRESFLDLWFLATKVIPEPQLSIWIDRCYKLYRGEKECKNINPLTPNQFSKLFMHLKQTTISRDNYTNVYKFYMDLLAKN